jgi:hypothetical protein
MSEHNIEVESGKSLRLKTAGKYCDRDVVVTATGGGGGDTEAAYQEGLAAGIEQGKQAEYDAFWDMYQLNGQRLTYSYAFSETWTDETFNPKYDMRPTAALSMFQRTKITDLVAALERAGIVLDTSGVTSFLYFMQDTKITHAPTIDCSRSPTIQNIFAFSYYLHTIDKLILHEGITQMQNAFNSCHVLENITIEGVIAKTISFQWSPLSDASVQSIIDHLKDLTGTTAQTLTLRATVGAKLIEEQKATITAKNWTLVY